MSPIRAPPSTSGEVEGDESKGCTYFPQINNQERPQQRNTDVNNRRTSQMDSATTRSIYNTVHSKMKTKLITNSREEKPRRNSEQRIPGTRTLGDYFPTLLRQTAEQQQTKDAAFIIQKRWQQRCKLQYDYKAQARIKHQHLQPQQIPLKGLVTPNEEHTRQRRKNIKNMNHFGTKTNRSILMEFNNESIIKNKRQSKLYDNEAWICDADKRETAGSFFGHSMAAIDNTSVYRVLLQNPNGIDPRPANFHFQLGLNSCYDNCVAFINLTETNLEWRNHINRQNLRNSLKKWWDGSTFQTATSSIPFLENYKPGGTVSIVCGNHWVARVIEKGDDYAGLGRWSYIGLQGNQQTKILHITWYLVCKQNVETAGAKTAFKQQDTLLREKYPDLNLNPRRQSVLDMQSFIVEKQQEGYFIILSTDSNENLSASKSSYCPVECNSERVYSKNHDGSVLTLAKTCGLIDILRQQHTHDSYPATYIRGRNRIDGIFISHQIVHAVLRSGLTPFHTFFQGDHKAAFVDFSAELLFRSNTYELVRRKGRGLQLKDPRIVDIYIQTLFDQLAYHKIMEKLDRLFTIKVGDWTDEDTITYVKLDKLITEAMAYAERTCSKRYSTTFQWSPLLLKAVYAYRYARLRLKEFNGIPVTEKTLQYHQKQAEITEEQHKNLNAIDKIVNFLRESKTKMKEHQKRHVELRKGYVESLSEAMVLKHFPTAEEGTSFFNEQKEKQLKALSNRESARTMHYKIRTALNQHQGGGTTRVDVPDTTMLFAPDGTSFGDPKNPKHWKGGWLAITEPEDMLNAIMEANITQYHQAHETPFAQEPLFSLFGPDGTTPFAQEFVKGRQISEDILAQMKPETKRILEAYQFPVTSKYTKTMEITSSMFISCYKNINEKTSSSIPSSRHVGKYKAALEYPSLVQMYSRMMTMPYTHGFTFDRWRKVVDVVLPKDAGEFKIHRFRIIRLVESDFNESLGMLFARPIGHFLEDANEYPDMQYGSRDGQMTISAVFNKILTFDIVRMMRIIMATEENDAVGCYDRVMQQMVALYLIRLGIAIAALNCVCRTFDETKHYIKTAHGLSEAFYEGTKEVPLYGAGQGTTVGPFFWLLIFSIMMEAFDPQLRGMTFMSPCRTIRTERLGDAFVDDTKFGVTAEHLDGYFEPTPATTQSQVQTVLDDLTRLSQHYEKLLYTSGGALNIKKCHWILMAWKWVYGRAYLMHSKECPGQLFLTSGSSTDPEEVPRLEPTTSYRTLGVHITVTGSMKKAMALNRQKSEDYAGLLGNSTLNRCEAYFSYILYFFPKISYSLPLMTFTQKECTYIQAPAMSAFLPKIGLNRHTSRSIIHGPTSYGGLQIKDAYTEQGIGQIRLLLGHLRRKDNTSKLVQVAISIMQQRVGAKGLFFNLPYPKYAGWLESTWLASIWQFLHILDLQIIIPSIPLPQEQRDNDIFLMSEFIYQGFKKGELELINQCRLYHQVITLTDITVADGTELDNAYISMRRNEDRVSTLQWPVQHCPSPKAWKQWNRALQYLLYKGKLQKPLGKWKKRPHQKWAWLIRLEDMVLFHRLPQGWETFHPIEYGAVRATRSTTKFWYFRTNGVPSAPPEGDIAVATPQFNVIDGELFTIICSERLPPPRLQHTVQRPETTIATSQETYDESIDLPLLLPDFLSGIETSPYFRRLVGPIQMPQEEDLVEIVSSIITGTLFMCSDGSFHPHQGTGSHAWVFATATGQILLQGAGPIDCDPDQLSSYRPELGGIVSLLFLLTVIVRISTITDGQVKLYCDNQSALDNVFDSTPKRGIFPLLAVDYDLLVLAKDMLQSLPITISWGWVKGHYTGDNRELQHDLNALADELATRFREDPPKGYEPTVKPMFHSLHEAALYKDGSMVTGKLSNMIYERKFLNNLTNTIVKRAGWQPEQFRAVDWDIFGKVFGSYSRFHQISIAKFAHGLWHTGEQKVLYRMDQIGSCPCCKSTLETTQHVFQCLAPAMVEHRNNQLTIFADYLDKQELPSPVKQCMYAGMKGWIDSALPAPTLLAPTRGKLMPTEQMSTAAFMDQSKLGWDAFFRGQLSKLWRKTILFCNPIRDEEATETHLRRIIQKLHSFSLAVWECRNGILHGASAAEKKDVRSALIREKVSKAYMMYATGQFPLLARDNSLFKAKTETERLKSDDDFLLCWLRSLEIAQNAYERRQAKFATNAAAFFQPFRALGRQRLPLTPPEKDPNLSNPVDGRHFLREMQQLTQEISGQTQTNYTSRRQHHIIFDSLQTTELGSILDEGCSQSSIEQARSPDTSIVSAGPFHQRPLVDQDYSTDSSYVQSRRRDVAHSFDTFTASSATEATPAGYRAETHRHRLDRMDRLLEAMDTPAIIFIPDLFSQRSVCSSELDSSSVTSIPQNTVKPFTTVARVALSANSPSLSVSTAAVELCQRSLRSYLRYRRDYLARQFASMEDGRSATTASKGSSLGAEGGFTTASMSFYNPVEECSTESSSVRQQLRFPLHQIAEISDLRKPRASFELRDISGDGEVSPPFSISATHVDFTATSPISPKTSDRRPIPPPSMIYIEELSPSAVGSVQHLGSSEHSYLQLAQNTPDSFVEDEEEIREDNTLAFREWIAGLSGFTPPTTASGSTFTSFSQDTPTLSFNNSRLEILSTPDSASSVTDISSSEPYTMRGLTLDLPYDVPPDEDTQNSGNCPSLAPGDSLSGAHLGEPHEEDVIEIESAVEETFSDGGFDLDHSVVQGESQPVFHQGKRQGVSMAPIIYYMLHVNEIEGEAEQEVFSLDSNASTASSMPELRDLEGNLEQTNGSHSGQMAQHGAMLLTALTRDDGDTEASTSSYLSHLDVRYHYSPSIQGREGYVLIIPIRELDDPPDDIPEEAASPEGEIEH